MKKTRLPKSPRALEDHIHALTQRIERLSAHIGGHLGKNFRDKRGKWTFGALIQRRGQALELLKFLVAESHQRLITRIKEWGDE